MLPDVASDDQLLARFFWRLAEEEGYPITLGRQVDGFP